MRKLACTLLGCAAAIASSLPASAALFISNDPTSNVTCSAGVCSATAVDAVLNAADLASALALGNVNVESGSDAMDIGVTAPVAWSTRRTLTLTADRSIAVNAAVVAQGTGARVVLVTGSGGDLTFTGGSLDFWSTHSHLTINGTAYTLAADLSGLAAAIARHPGKAFALAKSYDAGPDGTYAHAPVPTTFTGLFEGLGHTVSNLTIVSSDSNVGLFALAQTNASLRDLSLTNASVTGTPVNGQFVGALLGNGDGRGIVVNHVAASGTVSGYVAGGIMGQQYTATLNDAAADVAVTATSYGGGLVGSLAQQGMITNSHATGAVSGIGAGGLAGIAAGVLNDDFATGNVTESMWGGGLVGYCGLCAVQYAYATGSVTSAGGSSNTVAGGLLGYVISSTAVRNVYALGNVSAGPGGSSGGLIGQESQYADIEHSYAAGTVSGGHANQLGGFGGRFDFAVQVGNVWDVTTGGAVPKHGVGKCAGDGCKTTMGLTTTQLQSGLPAGFSSSIWGSNPAINGGLPYLLALPPQ